MMDKCKERTHCLVEEEKDKKRKSIKERLAEIRKEIDKIKVKKQVA